MVIHWPVRSDQESANPFALAVGEAIVLTAGMASKRPLVAVFPVRMAVATTGVFWISR